MNSEAKLPDPEDKPRRGGRPAAGTDPAKRRQIMDGAAQIFTSVGFDAASMNDVAQAADVSKATLYVYFPDKERLFAAVCAERRDRNISELVSLLDRNKPLEEVLYTFGSETLRLVSAAYVMAAHRIVIGVAERMPDIGEEFFASGPHRIATALAELLQHHANAGRLELDDTYLAAAQFLELTQAGQFRPRLYGAVREPISEAEIERTVGSAVRMLLLAYGRPSPAEKT